MSAPRGHLLERRSRFPLDGRLHKLWWHWTDVCWDVWPYSLPMWPWRWMCWVDGGHDDWEGCCIRCHKPTPAS